MRAAKLKENLYLWGMSVMFYFKSNVLLYRSNRRQMFAMLKCWELSVVNDCLTAQWSDFSLAVVICTEPDQTCLPVMSHVSHTNLRYQLYPTVTQQLMGRLLYLPPYYLISNTGRTGKRAAHGSVLMSQYVPRGSLSDTPPTLDRSLTVHHVRFDDLNPSSSSSRSRRISAPVSDDGLAWLPRLLWMCYWTARAVSLSVFEQRWHQNRVVQTQNTPTRPILKFVRLLTVPPSEK